MSREEYVRKLLEAYRTTPGTTGADSEGCRSAFRTDVDHCSEVMPISVPN